MSKKELDIAYFVSFCIEQYKVYAGKDGATIAEDFFSNGVSDYLADNYEILHTQSRQWLMEEIKNYINNHQAS